MLKHPRELGFTLGLKIRIIGIGHPPLITPMPDASMCNIVYVALFAENGTLETGSALKVGQTRGSALSRWKGIARLFTSDNLKPNEIEDRRKLLELTRFAEEEFLDEYYWPKFGIRLNRSSKVLAS